MSSISFQAAHCVFLRRKWGFGQNWDICNFTKQNTSLCHAHFKAVRKISKLWFKNLEVSV